MSRRRELYEGAATASHVTWNSPYKSGSVIHIEYLRRLDTRPMPGVAVTEKGCNTDISGQPDYEQRHD